MIRAYRLADARLLPLDAGAADVVWWDLFEPGLDEERALESRLALALPTRDEMLEIEVSSRLYSENGGHFMTALIPSRTDGDDPVMAPITFILTGGRLVTIRYTTPRAFDLFPQRAEKTDLGLSGGEGVLLSLFEAIVDRIADILERAGREIDALSRGVFGTGAAAKGRDYRAALEQIGRKGDLVSNLRDSLATLERVMAFLGPKLPADPALREQHAALVADVRSLADHAGFVSQKITFLLDATLGFINIEQNAIIKIFSVAAVVFLPPTLIASVYGMNFDTMPELRWPWGYPMALGLMVLSVAGALLFFRRRGWL